MEFTSYSGEEVEELAVHVMDRRPNPRISVISAIGAGQWVCVMTTISGQWVCVAAVYNVMNTISGLGDSWL